MIGKLRVGMVLLQLNHPDMVDGLVLVNCSATKAGWMEWGYQKVSPHPLFV